MSWTSENLRSKTCIVTGGNAGLGFAVCTALAHQQAHVILTARSSERGNRAVEEIKKANPDANVEFMALDLASFASIRTFAAEFLARKLPLHILLANAGVFCPPHSKTEEGFEVSVGVKHFGHLLLIQLLLQALKDGAPARIVFMSGAAEQDGKIDWEDIGSTKVTNSGYGQAALANLYVLMDTVQLNKQLKGSGIEVFACHPGLASTEASGKIDGNWLKRGMMRFVFNFLGQSAAKGATSMLHAATAPELSGKGGTYYGPNPMNMGNTKERMPKNKLATDPAAASRLYEATCQIIMEHRK